MALQSIPIIFLFLGLASAKMTGAPDAACATMTPGHGFQPQVGNSPFRIIMSKTTSSGEPIEITLAAPSQGPKFRGFLVQVRPVGGGDTPVGEFNPTADPQAQPVNCGGKSNTAMTHKDNKDKDQVKLQWTPPQQDGQYEVFVTFVQQQDTYWIKQMPDGDKITVTATAGRSGPGATTGSGSGQEQATAGGAPSNTNNNANAPTNTNSNTNSNSSQQPPSEGGASANIPLWSGISITATTVMISFFRYADFRLF